MNRFYVYVWIRKDTNNVFYVGKGSNNRYKDLSMRISGFKGHKHTDRTKKILKEKATGRPSYWKGKTLPLNMKEKMIATQKMNAQNRTYATAKEIVVLDANGFIIKEFKSRSECVRYYSSCETPISEACIKKYLKTGNPFNSQFQRHKKYLGIRFVFKSVWESQSTIESIDNEKTIIE